MREILLGRKSKATGFYSAKMLSIISLCLFTNPFGGGMSGKPPI